MIKELNKIKTYFLRFSAYKIQSRMKIIKDRANKYVF